MCSLFYFIFFFFDKRINFINSNHLLGMNHNNNVKCESKFLLFDKNKKIDKKAYA